jgi:hypothetical protein
MAAMIVQADDPTYVPVGGNVLMLLGEFSRTVTIECRSCKRSQALKLITDEILEIGECDELLDAWLMERGWRPVHDHTHPHEPDDYEFCPDCADR